MAAIDALPGLRINERELIRSDSDNWSILIVEMLDSKDKVALQCVRDVDESAGCPELGFRKAAQRMKGEIVEPSGKQARDDLVLSVQ